ncbi:DUF7410 domain-containing protein [Natronobiforma cellulositropha]|uniref:DUF7410 domain-containing protein n=1 Tax=Natronobiforma cellulositropha TaxID=1679076 RepID=UPI0021D61417|nr:hypothetical protein [Natronobiforma cellulositropha]
MSERNRPASTDRTDGGQPAASGPLEPSTTDYSTTRERANCTCRYCGRPFSDERYLALHRGLEHPERLGAGEWEAYEVAVAADAQALRRYKLYALCVIVVVYFGFVLTYAAVT